MQESNLDKLLTENKVSHPFFVGMEEVNKEWVNSQISALRRRLLEDLQWR